MPDEQKRKRADVGQSTGIDCCGPVGSRRSLLKSAVAASAVFGVGLTGTAGSVSARDGTEEASADVVLRDQPTDGRIVVAESVRLPDGGYVGIHWTLSSGSDDGFSILGTSEYLEAGEHEIVAIEMFDLEGVDFEVGHLLDDDYLLAVPHRETTGNEVNEFAATSGEEDVPYTEDGAPIADMGYATVIEDEAVANVSFRNQRAEGATVTVDTVTLSDGGFVALHDATAFEDDLTASVVGVSQHLGYGIHEEVEVRLFSQATGVRVASGSPRPVVAVPHLDTNENEAFDFLETGAGEDGPYLREDRPVTDYGFVT